MKVQQQPSDEELTQFGIRFQDEEMAPFDPEDPSWNDSVFYDFYNDDGSTAGNVRIGALPNEGRVWFWLYLSARLSFEEVTALARVTQKRGTLKEGCPFLMLTP